MKIKKLYQGKTPDNKILNTYSDSLTNTYSCQAINTMINEIDISGSLDDLVGKLDSMPIGTIVDYAGDTVPDGYARITDEDDYVEGEVIIGTWCGKPLYRRCFKFTSYLPTVVASNIEHFITCNICIYSSGAWRTLPFAFTNTDTGKLGEPEWTGGFHITDDGRISYFLGSGIGRVVKGTAVFEYTKTTD